MAYPDEGRGGILPLISCISLVVALSKFLIPDLHVWLLLLLGILAIFSDKIWQNLEQSEPPKPNSCNPVEDSGPGRRLDPAGEASRQDQRSDPAPLPPGYEYEVFLNFRGPDTRRGFVDCLYNSMRDAGIHVFRDNEELRPGDKIGPKLRRGIAQSKIAIPILSKGYADSNWCLEELAFIDRCRREAKQIVIPIFYDVTTHLVSNNKRTGSYEEALRRHANTNPQCVEQWRNSLSALEGLKGWELKHTANGLEGRLIKLVVNDVLLKLKKTHLPVTKYLVGVEDHANAVMSLLDAGDGDVRMVGIHGISGVGKTTLAKYIYNKLLDSSEFEGCSSLCNIRENSQQLNGLQWLQSKLVVDITRHQCQYFSSVDEGINTLNVRFRSMKVLILLDDVGTIEQLNALVAERDWFGTGSRIIVTTTDGCILREAPQVNSSYELGSMEDDEALELFNKHAFRTGPSAGHSSATLKPLANKIVRATGGIPLALEIIGSFLYGRSREQWKATLKKLSERPDKKVLDKLRISYDDLENEYQQIFLDIACFFIGVDFRIVFHMWEDCNFFPKVGIEVLQLRCLVKIGEDKKLWMHDSLRDLGREIVRQEKKSLPRKRSRLWHSEEARNVLLHKGKKEKIEAISIQREPSVSIYSLEGNDFTNMPKLRFLQLDFVRLMGDFQPLSELRWLCGRRSSVMFINGLPLAKLKILDISRSDVTVDWKGWSSIKKPIKLKVLDLSGCHQLRQTPNFSMFPNLEMLILEDCKRLDDVHKSMVDLQYLSSLNLKNCSKIIKLPDQLGSMKELTELIVDGTSIIKLPDSICSLRNLQKLSANDCRHLQSLPSSIGQLNLLVELSLSHTSVVTLPDSVGNLSNMEVLNINSSKMSHFPRDLGKLGKLKVLDASMCENLKGVIPAELGRLCSLEDLRLDGTGISSIPDTICGLSHLQRLHLMGCLKLQSLPELTVSLVSVRVTCQSEEAIPDLSALINLKELVLSISTYQCNEGSLTWFEKLSIQSRRTHHQLPRSLHKLSISNSSLQITLSNLQNLLELYLERCYELKEIPGLRDLVILKSLKVSFCPKITSLRGLEKLKSLRMLLLSSCGRLKKLPNLSMLKKLSVINAQGCKSLLEIPGLDNLYALTDLDISNCSSMKKLDLWNSRLLRSLSVHGCMNLQALEGLGELKELLFLRISRCTEIKCLPDLSKLKKLRYFNIVGCRNIKEVCGLLGLNNLEHIIVSSRITLAKSQDVSGMNEVIRKASQAFASCRIAINGDLVIYPRGTYRDHESEIHRDRHNFPSARSAAC